MNLQHHFLIAMPALQDPIFRRSVVYICEYNEDGAMGIIINKPLENLQVEGILEKLKITAEERLPEIRLDKPVMLGGPLAEDRGFILHTPPAFSSSIRISDNTVITTSRDVLETLGTANSLLKCWLRWAIRHGKKASSSRRSWIMPGSRPLPI
jgi:putative transcriptional regulator